MNTNNNNNNRNNRRRGRGNRNQGGNGAQLNRIDSRARGNAPQMLDKYKKLAQDAHHNGDRVQMEYYLQFADHYFRVIADNKARVDEQRGGPRRNDERDQAEEYGDDDIDFGAGRRNEQPARSRYEQQDNVSRSDQDEGEQGQEGESFLSDGRDDDPGAERAGDRSEQQPRQQNTRRQPRKPRDSDRSGDRETARPERAERPERSEKRPERAEAKPAPRARKPRKPAEDDRGGIDSSILPPSIRGDDSNGSSGDSDGTLETVG